MDQYRNVPVRNVVILIVLDPQSVLQMSVDALLLIPRFTFAFLALWTQTCASDKLIQMSGMSTIEFKQWMCFTLIITTLVWVTSFITIYFYRF